MTAINRLNQKEVLDDLDIMPIWDSEAGRTRAVLASTIGDYVGQSEEGSNIKTANFAKGVLTLNFYDGTTLAVPNFNSANILDFPDTLNPKKILSVKEDNSGYELVTNPQDVIPELNQVVTWDAAVSVDISLTEDLHNFNIHEIVCSAQALGISTISVLDFSTWPENSILKISPQPSYLSKVPYYVLRYETANSQVLQSVISGTVIFKMVSGDWSVIQESFTTSIVDNDDNHIGPINQIKVGSGIDLEPLPNNQAQISQDTKISPWDIVPVGIGDSPYVIENSDQLGKEYEFTSSALSQSVILNKSNGPVALPEGAQVKVTINGDVTGSKPIQVSQIISTSDVLRWPVLTPTVFTLRSGVWRIEESSQLVSSGAATTFDESTSLVPIHAIAVDPEGSVTSSISEDGVMTLGGGIGQDINLSEFAKLGEENTFTENQTIDNADFKVNDSNGESVFDISPNDKMVKSSAALNISNNVKAQSLESTILDSAQSSNLLLKWKGENRVYIGGNDVTFIKKVIANAGTDIAGDSTYDGDTSLPKSLMNREAVEGLIPEDEGPYVYDGEGFGVPGRIETGAGTIVQTAITGNYRNTSDDTGDLKITLSTEDGVQNFRLYYSLPYGTLSGRKVYVQVDQKAGNNKTIRSGETWLCQVKAGRFFDDFFWSKVTDGESTFEAIDTSGFDVVEPEILPLLKRFSNTDLIEIPLELPEGYTVVVRQVVVKRSSGVELEMDFTYRHENGVLKIHTNESGSGLIIAGIIKDEI